MASTSTLWITIGLNLVMALVYYAVGRVIARRTVSQDAELAKSSFSGFWYALAAVTASGALSTVIGSQGWWTVSGLVAYTQVILFVILAALGALLYYFVYLFTGKRASWKWVALAYGAYYVAILYFLAVGDPVGVVPSDQGGQELEYANDLSDSAFASFLGLMLLLPILIGALGYVSLIRKVPNRSGKFRIGSVAGAFIFWFGSSLLATEVFEVAGRTWWQPVSTAISLVASALVYIAFAPPPWLAAKLHVEGYDAPLKDGDGSK